MQGLIGSIDEFGLAGGSRSYVYLGQRLVRGWAIELALVAMLLPFAVTAVDLFARCRRRRIPVAPALRSYRSRLGFWIWCGLMFLFLGAIGVWPDGAARPLNPETRAATHWPVLGIVLLVLLIVPGWLVSRARLTPRRPPTAEEELAGHTAAMLVLGVVALLVVATNPFALLFLLPRCTSGSGFRTCVAGGRSQGSASCSRASSGRSSCSVPSCSGSAWVWTLPGTLPNS